MHSKLFLHETAGSKQKCLIYNSSQFPPIIPVARKKTSHRLSPKFLPTQSSQQMAAPGIVCFGNRKTQASRADRGRDQTSPDTSVKTEDAPGPSCWRRSVYLWLQDRVPSATRASGITYLERRAFYSPRIKMALSFPIEKKRAKPLFTPFPFALSFTWVLTQGTTSRTRLSKQSDFPEITFSNLHHPFWLHTSNLTPLRFPLQICVCASPQRCWDEFAAGMSKEGRSDNFVFVYGRKLRCS